MFSKILNRSQAIVETIPEPLHEITVEAAWESRLQAALGNDTELLALAIEAPSVEHKLSALQALSSEEALKSAEREFRKHDRRAHSLAKQRYEAAVKLRETRASAAELIRSATALLEAPIIPANRLSELNQAWELLDHSLIDDGEKSRFARLQANLTELIRERVERKRAASRWTDAAKQAIEEMNMAFAGVAVESFSLQEIAGAFAKAGEKIRAAQAQMPASDDAAAAALGAAMQSALQDAAAIEARLTYLGELQKCLAPQNPPAHEEPSGASLPLTIPATSKSAAIEHWKSLPPLADPRIEKALNARLDGCFQFQEEARKKLKQQNDLIASEKSKAAQHAKKQTLKAAADAAEAALAAGQLGEAGEQLTILQAATGKCGAELQARIGALQAEFARLKGWQRWGGGRVRDDLVAEAEALAASTAAAEGSPPVKLPLKALENSIEQLRARWKELDKLGGATSKDLWQRFDAALKTAYLPVAAHQAKLKEARQENLSARKALLDSLDALDVSASEQNTPDWKEVNRAMANFQIEWRKLGPIEHTVPHKAQPALLERMKSSIARIEEPLREVQAGAQTQREQLIARASALGQDVHSRDMMAKLRELQAQWQSCAKSQPLPRKTENKLWAEFKAATDALMSQRAEAFGAREAGLKASQAAREALIARLEELHQDTPTADIRRMLASVDTEWRNAGEAPRNQAAKLESRYRAAREQAQQHIAGSAQRAWQHTCDALLAKLAMCEELESAASSSSPLADIEARWQALPVLPPSWEQALQARLKSGGDGPANSGEPLDRLLLQLESALEIPSPAAFQAARQTLKLMAMKSALEGSKSATHALPDIEKTAAAAFGCSRFSAEQRSRLLSIIAALRKTLPGKQRV